MSNSDQKPSPLVSIEVIKNDDISEDNDTSKRIENKSGFNSRSISASQGINKGVSFASESTNSGVGSNNSTVPVEEPNKIVAARKSVLFVHDEKDGIIKTSGPLVPISQNQASEKSPIISPASATSPSQPLLKDEEILASNTDTPNITVLSQIATDISLFFSNTHKFMFAPIATNSKFLSIWNAIVDFVHVVNLIWIPVILGWPEQFLASWVVFMILALDIMNITDCYFNSRLSYKDEYGIFVEDPALLRKRYLLHRWGILEIISSLPWEFAAFINSDLYYILNADKTIILSDSKLCVFIYIYMYVCINV